MSINPIDNKVCVVIGASHAGINFAFHLRREGWQGDIIVYDKDPNFPYHKPPLSKAYLANDESIDKHLLKPVESYERDNITLRLGKKVRAINRDEKRIVLSDGNSQQYNKLVIATGARPLIPPIEGINDANKVFPLRSIEDVTHIRETLSSGKSKRVVIIGGGYIGLETAASLSKLGAKVTVVEREDRVLARVTAPCMSAFFHALHADNGVNIVCGKKVVSLQSIDGVKQINCADGSQFEADMVVIGVGIQLNLELAQKAGLVIENGIRVDQSACTNDANIYAIGDCSFHYNPHYDRFIRLESVQNAIDQAKVAASAICGKDTAYDTIPWFWSDQYDVKLQLVGLSTGYDQVLVRHENGDSKRFSVWYFKGDTLLAVDAVNNAKAYVLGTKFIKSGQKLDKVKLANPSVALKPANILRA
ncbi:3-phenylpropionate/trans-cinnamate dioxygenase ferredoxin reductase subunit [Catalinimonas alkaloidigena]|uniref:NAD(P)/FAD-dependent oxidoreductase n=1 Tax=Catalinimonas alkaloidigena TaxID=1075417 RepID=UPI002405E798|nr:FAD-dependent oxidoreductase [Catalinimonas alkaloidigena]MDF9796457.1 3-phenylpropionate/trans-cinnamate dioxygenase ferredoxin reductase subunit [Catalinimonas alkaloidigena]